MKSMTGYSHLTLKNADVFCDIKIKSVNHRYFSFSINSPKEYRHLDTEIQKKVKKYIQRGSVEVFFHRRHLRPYKNSRLNVDLERAKQWHLTHQKIARYLKIPYTPSVESFMNKEDIVSFQDSFSLSLKEKNMFLSLLEKALKACDAERKREGLFLKKAFLKYFNQLDFYRKKLEKINKDQIKKMKEKKQNEIRELVDEKTIKPQVLKSFLNEIDKISIEEELQRLKSHIAYSKDLLKAERKGKQIDFYSQEILREVNTIGSKAENASLIHLVVECKDLVEKIREQAQNVE